MTIEDEVRAIVVRSQDGFIDEAVAALMRLMEPKLTAEQVAEAERLRQIMLDTVDEYKRKQEAAK